MAPKKRAARCRGGPKHAAKAKAKGKAKAKPEAAPEWGSRHNARQRARRAAIRDLNVVAEELGIATLPVKSQGKSVQKLLKRLQSRCPDEATAGRLRDAAQRWKENGGFLEGEVTQPDDSPAVCAAATAPVLRHKILEAPYRIRSKAFMLTYNSRSLKAEDWEAFRAFTESTARRLRATAWAACLEESTHANSTEAVFHGHSYYFWDSADPVDICGTDSLVFHQIRPRVDTCSIMHNPTTWKKAAMHGLWYVHVVKLGTVASASNYEPWVHYVPDGDWLVSLWSAHKLSHDQYEDLSAQFRTGHAARMHDLGAVRRSERAVSVRKHVQKEQELVSAEPMAKFKEYPEVAEFLATFAKPQRRRPILAIVGPTRLGKSLLAADVLRQVGELVGLKDFLEVTVQDNGSMDVSAFDVDKHAGILLDGVGDVQMLADNRETLQGRAKEDTGGKSATMMYSYIFTLCRRGVVATLDDAARNLEFFRTHHWLSHTENVIVLRLAAPAWSV